jgi:hypothetical protein
MFLFLFTLSEGWSMLKNDIFCLANLPPDLFKKHGRAVEYKWIDEKFWWAYPVRLIRRYLDEKKLMVAFVRIGGIWREVDDDFIVSSDAEYLLLVQFTEKEEANA